MSLPTLPSAAAVTPAELAEYGAQLIAWAEDIDDPTAVRDMANRWQAITDYVKRTSRDGIAEAEATLRRLEMRVGELIGPSPGPGRPSDGNAVATDISRHHRDEFRTMAEHPEIVEQVIAESTDADPPSRRKVIGRIRDTKQATETAAARAEDKAWAADLYDQSGRDPENDKRRQRIRIAIRSAADAVAELVDAYPPGDVAAALAVEPEHVRLDLARRLTAAGDQLEMFATSIALTMREAS